VKGKNGKYDFAIKCTTDNVLQILLQAMTEKLEKLRIGKKKNTPFINQSEDSILI
jgi:hypothetical protein